MRLRAIASATLASLSLLAVPALADDATPPAVAFPTLGADGLGSSIDARVGAVGLDKEGSLLHHLELGGQFVSAGGWGGYGRLAASTVEDSATIGSPELGVLYHQLSGSSDVAYRAGLVIPHEGGSDGNERLVHVVDTLNTRPSDVITAVQDTAALRLAIAPTIRQGSVVLRGDAGLDLPVGPDEIHPLFHLDVGVGFQAGNAALVAELANVLSPEGGGDAWHVAAVSGELSSGSVTGTLTLARGFAGGDEDGFAATSALASVRGAL